jgi:hypothetical protein
LAGNSLIIVSKEPRRSRIDFTELFTVLGELNEVFLTESFSLVINAINSTNVSLSLNLCKSSLVRIDLVGILGLQQSIIFRFPFIPVDENFQVVQNGFVNAQRNLENGEIKLLLFVDYLGSFCCFCIIFGHREDHWTLIRNEPLCTKH